MNNVVSLAEKRIEKSPHRAGLVKCLGCKHEWVGVCSMDTINDLECPECHTFRGVFMHNYCAPDGDLRWECHCGNDIFKVLSTSIMCMACGSTKGFAELAELQ